MCGIFGYAGASGDIAPAVLTALKALEYRGYDSWGVAVRAGDRIAVEKRTGKINGAALGFAPSDLGFGHTRWATHGGVTQANAHPHLDCTGALAVIHNGIVENHNALRAELVARGHRFASETDSEVVVHLLEDEVAAGSELAQALARVFGRLEGLNAVIAMDVRGKELAAAKNVSPLAVGANGRAATIASDAHALLGHADRVLYLEDHHLVRLRGGEVVLYDRRSMDRIAADFLPLDLEASATELGPYPHFMAKEMAEQPAVLDRLVAEARPQIIALAEAIRASSGTHLVGCGTASYAALSGAYLFGRIAARRVDVAVGSEFASQEHLLSPRSLVVALSQSGETADLIAAMLTARERGARLGAFVNAKRSTLDRMVDLRVHLNAGPEQCVLSTKAYTAKVAALLLSAHALAGSYEQGERIVSDAADGLRAMLTDDWVDRVRAVAHDLQFADHLFVIGRGLAYPTALEAALKIKEVSYVHAEGFAGGELKHGVIALVTDGTPCLVYAPTDETRADVISGATELKCRGGFIVGVGPLPDPVFDVHLPTPDVGDAAPIVHALPAQMLGYQLALLRGNDPDKPRNLAKSVTVK